MCKKKQFRYCPSEIDECIKPLINFMKVKGGKLQPVASCCGHGKYPMTIVVRNHLGHTWELMSNENISRKRNFYKKDKQGYYFIPEVVNPRFKTKIIRRKNSASIIRREKRNTIEVKEVK